MQAIPFKRGETLEITLCFEIVDDYGISSLTGVTAAAQLRRKHDNTPVAEFTVSLYPDESRVLLTLPSEISDGLKEGLYVADVAFTRVSDGLVQYSGDIAVEIIKSTSRHVDPV
ncbi:hypothetical protein [Neisseria perflava]|uniref:hypothetical protein n=1 Tax=Neisseria perflava TaxID=33053 RepID=UPI00209E824B|nr:hypothetical protein [Neisseria perflava]MCP1659352.1 hypothetical protein [Neisseria perflava]MCP1772843.1 hypothetical protein [Neisseria perflava]